MPIVASAQAPERGDESRAHGMLRCFLDLSRDRLAR
jgi:hypothetical protein